MSACFWRSVSTQSLRRALLWVLKMSCLFELCARTACAQGGESEKRHILQPVLRMTKTARREDWNWVLFAARVEYGKACTALAHYSEMRNALLRVAAETPELDGDTRTSLSELRSCTDAQICSGAWGEAVKTLQRSLRLIGMADGYTLACVNVGLAAIGIQACLLPEAERRLLRAVPVLRKRKGDDGRAAEAVKQLLTLVRPRKRLRGRSHPENILWDIPGTTVLCVEQAMWHDCY